MTDREPVDVTKEQLTVLCVKPGEKPKRIELKAALMRCSERLEAISKRYTRMKILWR